MKLTRTQHFANRTEWHTWLEQRHTTEKELWLIWYKAHTGIATVPLEEAIEEALCFGWIDSLVQKIDEDGYARKFTPRRPGSPWSELNKKRVVKLVAEGRMTPAGMALVDFDIQAAARTLYRPRPMPEYTPELEALLKANPAAWGRFSKMSPSHRRRYIGWVMDAKREETRLRRMQEVITVLAEGRELGLK
jgi:uncharacterized protein YdeI (YjbR/CyaY-like superfamily)